MTLPKWATTVTSFSKALAMFIFITFPIIGFWLGMKYQSVVDSSKILPINPVTLPPIISTGTPKISISPFPTFTPTQTPTPTPTPKAAVSYSSSEDDVYITEGNVYSDENCNEMRDWNEQALSGFKVTIFRLPQYYVLKTLTSDEQGNFSFSMVAGEFNSVSLRPAVTSQPGYQTNTHMSSTFGTVDLNKSKNKAFVYLPQYTYHTIGACK